MTPAGPAEMTFVGREAELTGIRGCLERAGAVISGPAGVGKSRLVSEALEPLDRSAFAIIPLFGTTAAKAVPLAAFAPLIPLEALRIDEGAIFRVVLDELHRRAANRRLVLAVDDAHLLDTASATVVEQLVRHRRGAVILTIRDGEEPGPLDKLSRDDLLTRIALEPLSLDAVAAAVNGTLDGPVHAAAIERIHRTAAGNPLLVREILHSGVLVRRGERWDWQGQLPVSGRLADLVSARLGGLGEPELEALRLLAFGEPLGVALLHKLGYADVLEPLEDRGLIRVQQAGSRTDVRLGHPLYGEVIRAECPQLKAIRLRAALADAVRATGTRRSGDLLRTVVWLLDGNADIPVDLLATAARQAYAASDLEMAQRLAQRALSGGDRVRAAVTMAESLLFDLRADAAEQLLADLWPALDDQQRLALTHTRGFNLQVGLARPADALILVDQAEGWTTDPVVRFQLETLRFGAEYMIGDYPAAVRRAERLLATELDCEPARGVTTIAYADAVAVLGRPERALEILDDYEKEATDRSGELAVIAGSEMARVRTQMRLGRLAQAGQTARQALERWPGWPFGVVVFGTALAASQRLTGAVADAAQTLQPALATVRGADLWESHIWCLAEAAHVAALRGQAAEAAALLAECERSARPGWRGVGFWLDAARPWVSAARGDLPQAIALALAAAGDAAALGATSFELEALHTVVRLGQPRSAAARLAALAVDASGPFPPLYAEHARALLASDADGLLSVATEFAALGLTLHAAEVTTEAAAALRKASRGRESLIAEKRAAALRSACQGAKTPALLAAVTSTLTQRETQIARLATEGLSNQQIADRLNLSRRTVGNHLYAIYAKLGTRDRTELRDRLGG